jgi:FLVCR family MFS transporter
MESVLTPHNAEMHAGWMGFGGALAGIASGVALSAYADCARGRKKALLVALLAAATACALAFALACRLGGSRVHGSRRSLVALVEAPHVDSAVPGHSRHSAARLVVLYITCVGNALCVNAAVPLFFECAVEAAFPIAEGLVTTSLTVVSNVFSLCFLLIPSLPHVGTQWMNWALVAACALALLIVSPLAEPRLRLLVDLDGDDADDARTPDATDGDAPVAVGPDDEQPRSHVESASS